MTIQEIEKEIADLRAQLNADQFRLTKLEYELNILKSHPVAGLDTKPVTPVNSINSNIPPVAPATPVAPAANIPPVAPATPVNPAANIPPVAPVAPATPVNPAAMKAKADKSFDLEKFIGKSWMGIMASVLIFISLIMFAVVILPILPDVVKMIIMFAVSIAFVSVGLVLYMKKESTFYMILSACGMGALYLSFLMSNIYFKVIGDIPLYICILVWAAGIAFIARKGILTFSIVGNVGINIAIILGVSKCAVTNDSVKFGVLAIFFIVSAIIYTALNNRFELSNIICNAISLGVLMIGFTFIDPSSVVLLLILLAAAIALYIYCAVKHVQPFFVFNTIFKWSIFLIWFIFIDACKLFAFEFESGTSLQVYIGGVTVYILSLFSILFINLYYDYLKEDTSVNNRAIVEIIDIVTIALSIMVINTDLFVYFVPTVFIAIFFIKKDTKYLVASFCTQVLALFFAVEMPGSIVTLALSIVLIIYSQLKEFKYNDLLKAGASIVLRIAALEILFDIFDRVNFSSPVAVTIALIVILIIDMCFKYLLSDHFNEKPVIYATYASTAISAIVVSALLFAVKDGFEYYLTLLVGCIIFMNNVVRFIKSDMLIKQIYAVIKITFYIIIVFASLEKATILLSIALFIAAIVWILLGFRMNIKSIRLYGLVTTIISIAKLLLLDIQYNSFLTRAAGFFVCGILAFLISFIYNRFEKHSGE